MNELTIDRLRDPLTVLSVAEEKHEEALAYLYQAKKPYAHAISLLQRAMEEDAIVQDAQEEVDEVEKLLARAKADAEVVGTFAFQDGLTEGKKEWAQDGYEVRVREVKEPVVVGPRDFLNHLEELGVDGVVKKISVSLNKKNTTELNDRVPLNGLKIEEKISCSVRREARKFGQVE